jgi:predicted  nucleic acid-binding Zn-ribbon protein
MDNKLNLMVNFMGVDKLSGSMKNIMMTSKSGGMALKGMKDEARKLETELKQVRKEIAAGTGNMTQLINRERQLESATAGANAKLDAQAKRLTSIR